jgi:hypothetical protein
LFHAVAKAPSKAKAQPSPFPQTPQSLRASNKEPALEARLRALTEQLTSDAYAYVCTGLFEAHKLLFSFSLAVKVLEGGPRAPDPQAGLASLRRTLCFACARLHRLARGWSGSVLQAVGWLMRYDNSAAAWLQMASLGPSSQQQHHANPVKPHPPGSCWTFS